MQTPVATPKRSSRKSRLLVSLLLAGLLGFALDWLIAGAMIAPCQRPVTLPATTNLTVESVQFPSASGATLRGWLVPATNSPAVIILLHGVHADRRTMWGRVGFLHDHGYSLLLFDFQAHGESLGRHITFGYLESRDATAAVAFARQRFPGQKIATLGVSMGGAAALLAQPPLAVDAMIVESCYPTFSLAVADRMIVRFGPLGKYAGPLLTWQMKPRLGISADDLRPIRAVAQTTVPKLILSGEADPNTTLPETQALFAAAAGPKELLTFPGAGHQDLQAYAPKIYEPKVLAFLTKYLARNPE